MSIVSGGPNINGNGGNGNSLSFDGSGGKVNIMSGITDLSGTGSWTISSWVQTSQSGSTILSKDTDGTWVNGNSIFYFGSGANGSGTLPSAVRNSGGFLSGSTPVTDGNWHMITYVDNAGTKAIYVDGVADALSQTDFNNTDIGDLVQLGFSPDTVVADGTTGMYGNLDDINIYSGSLTASQVTNLYNTNNAGANPTPNTALPVGSALKITSGSAVIAAHNSSSASVAAQASTLTLGGTTDAWTGVLDVTNNGIDLTTGSLATITNQVKNGFNGGKWNGTGGILSSGVASDTTHLTAVGILVNDNGHGVPLYGSSGTLGSTFNGIVPADGDILLKYTYFGDANLDGKVDGSDYTRIDSGFLTRSTGWYNGDFNYDGVVNGSDYTLIDNAFNRQSAILTAEVATSTAEVAGGGSRGT